MVTEVISAIVESLGGFLTGLGSAIISFFDGVFIVTTETGVQLTSFSTLALAFVGIGLAFTVVRWVFRLIRA